jgi:predicted GIY-YIG superfamily endonuclease
LFSETRNKYYVGITTETTANRLKKHHESNFRRNIN